MKLVSVLTRMRMYAVDALACIPVETSSRFMMLMTDDALVARREIAKNLTVETIDALRAKPDPRTPNLELMQTLYDSGIRQCPLSGTPVFDPSKLEDSDRAVLWRAYCGVGACVDDVSKTPEMLAALDALRDMFAKRATPVMAVD